jgi:heme exporter protein D
MNKYNKLVSLISATAFLLVVVALPSPAAASHDGTSTPHALTCTPQSVSVNPNQQVTFTASGGDGNYVWSAPQMAPRTGAELTVYYPWAGSSVVSVSSAGQTANCNVTIVGEVLGDATLACVPSQSTVAIGQVVTFSAVGGDGNYVWSAPGVASRTGSTFTAFYPQAGQSSVTVASAGQTATCNVTIAGAVLGGQTPGLPNTGMGGDATNLFLNLGVLLALSGMTTLVLRKRMAK